MRKKHVMSVMALLAAVGVVQLRAGAETMADRVPGDALVYAQWAGSDALGASYDGSHLKGMVDAFNLPQFISQMMAAHEAKETDPQKVAGQKLVHELVPVMIASPTGWYVGPFDVSVPNDPQLKIGIFSKMGKENASKFAGEVEALIEEKQKAALAANPDRKEPPVACKAVGDYLVLEVGDASELEKKLGGDVPTDGLSSTEGYKAAMGQVHAGSSSAASIYVNGEAALKVADDAITANGGARMARLWPLLEDALGLTGIRQIAWSGNFDGKDWHSEAFVGLRERRVGLTAFLDSTALPVETFKMIPKSATWAGVFRFDGDRLVDDIRTGMLAAGEQQGKQFDFAMRQFYAFTGVDLQKDLLASLGDAYVIFGMPDANGKTFKGLTIENKLRDAAKAETAFSTLESVVSAMAQQRGAGEVQFTTQPLAAPLDKVTAHVIATKVISPAWAVSDGVLYFSESVEALQSAIGAGANGGSILDNPVFAEARAKIGQNAISAFQFDDMAANAGATYDIYSKFVEAVKRKNPSEFVMPPLEKLTPNLSPSLMVMWTDQDGFHMSGNGPFPFSNALSPARSMFLSIVMSAEEAKRKAVMQDTPAPAQ